MHDLDPHYLLPVWRALVRYFRRYPPLLQADQQLPQPMHPQLTREPPIQEGQSHELRDCA